MTKVARVVRANLDSSLRRAIRSIGDEVLASIDRASILIKANFNSPYPYPASSDLGFLSALTGALLQMGASRVAIGDSCGLRWRPADEVFRKLGIPALAEWLGAECINFDHGPWRHVPVGSKHFKEIPIAASAFDFDMIVYAGCMKTHRAARFSLSLKHTVGFLPPDERRALHDGDIEEKIADINLAVSPAIAFIDARKCFVAGGPARGWVRRPNVLLASTDRVALDVEAIKVLSSFRSLNRLIKDPWQHPQIRRAVELGLGVSAEDQYEVTEG